MQKIHLIARGIVISGDHVLLVKETSDRYYFLPGGHIEYNEAARDALIREMKEELGASCMALDYVSAVEHKYDMNDETYHEISLVFKCELNGLNYPDPPISLESRIEFEWIAIAELKDHDILPEPMVQIIEDVYNKSVPGNWFSTIEGSFKKVIHG